MKYAIQDREAGNLIDTFDSIDEAEKVLKEYEKTDKAEGTFEPEFYEIVEQ